MSDDSDLILVECPTCDGGRIEGGNFWVSVRWPKSEKLTVIGSHLETCPECEGAGWLLVEGSPISLEDLERMAPWADAPAGRPLESGEVGIWPAEIQYVDGIAVGRM